MQNDPQLIPPFPYPGGKRRIAPLIWRLFGDPDVYLEPFLGGGSVFLARPFFGGGRLEIINDKNGFVSNFWRSVKYKPDEVIEAMDWPNIENDFHARHIRLTMEYENLVQRLEGDPAYCDPVLAGWWAWGASLSLPYFPWGASTNGPWVVRDNLLCRRSDPSEIGIHRSHPEFRPYFVPELLIRWLSQRLKGAVVLSGDWKRSVPSNMLRWKKMSRERVAVFMDPPYTQNPEWDRECYLHNNVDGSEILEWCSKAGAMPGVQIILCGYDRDWQELEAFGWKPLRWKIQNAMRTANRSSQTYRQECLWLSPHIKGVMQLSLFEAEERQPSSSAVA